LGDEAAEHRWTSGELDAFHRTEIPSLHAYRLALCAAVERDVPYFDPLDGGEHAEVLILLERPTRKGAHPRVVSRDNRSPTQKNLKRFLNASGVDRKTTVLWNLVPWLPATGTSRNRPTSKAEIREGLDHLPELLQAVPNLRIAVLAGKIAGMAEPVIAEARPDVTSLHMPHPSPVYVNTSPAILNRIHACLERVPKLLAKVE